MDKNVLIVSFFPFSYLCNNAIIYSLKTSGTAIDSDPGIVAIVYCSWVPPFFIIIFFTSFSSSSILSAFSFNLATSGESMVMV